MWRETAAFPAKLLLCEVFQVNRVERAVLCGFTHQIQQLADFGSPK